MLGHSRESMRRNWPPIATFRRRANVPRSRSTGEYITTRLRGRRAGTLPFAGVPGSARARPGTLPFAGAPPPGGLCRAMTLEESTGSGEGGG